MSTWHDARVAAQQRLILGEGLSVDAWRQLAVTAVTDLVAAGMDDAALEMVGTLATSSLPVAGRQETSVADPLIDTFADAGSTQAGVDEDTIQEARTALLLATHLGLRSVTDETSERILVAAERELLPHHHPGPPAAALNQWRFAVMAASERLSPSEAVTLARRQRMLLQHAGRCLQRVDAPAAANLDRINSAIATGVEGWSTAVEAWQAEIAPGQRTGLSSAAAELNRAWLQVATALQEEPSPHRWVAAMIETNFAGALSAGMTLRGPGESVSLLTRVGVELEVAAEHLHGVRFTDKPVTEPHLDRSDDRTHPDHPADPVRRAGGVRSGVDVGSDSLAQSTPENHRRAVVARDAGVIAQAALEGDPTARELARGVSDEHLAGLVETGHRAEAQLLLWAKSVAIAAVRQDLAQVPSQVREDAAQDVLAYVGSHLHRFDPDKGALTTFAHAWAKYGFLAWQRHYLKPTLRETAVDFAEQEHVQAAAWQRETQSADKQVLEAVSAATLRAQVAMLPPEERAVVVARFGLDGQGVRTLDAVAAGLGISSTTVRRRETSGLEQLRRIREQTPLAREVTMRDLAVRLQAAAPRQLLVTLRANAARRRDLSPQRPLIDQIRETALRQRRWQRAPAKSKTQDKTTERTSHER